MREAMLLLATLGAVACSGGDKSEKDTENKGGKNESQQMDAKAAAQAAGGIVSGIMKMAAEQDSIDKTNPYHALEDPCILVSRAEVEKYIGPLRADPWQNGSSCVYDAASGRSITLDVTYSGGKIAMKMMKGVGGLTSLAIADESGKADTLDGDWDEVRWGYGSLSALKGDVLVEVNVEASQTGPVGAAELATIALKRLPSPLHYDGAAAAAHKPGPLVEVRDPCSLVTKEEASQILGKLIGDPTSDKGGCTFTVPSPLRDGATMPVELTVSWTNGFAKFGEEKEVNEMAEKSFIGPAMSGAGQMAEQAKTDPEAKAAMENARSSISAMGGPALKDGSLEFKTDTAVTGGPWDEAAILTGMTFAAVKKDVYMSMSVQMLGEAKARAMVAKAMSRI